MLVTMWLGGAKKTAPIIARIFGSKILSQDEMLLTLSAGSDEHVAKNWNAEILREETDKKLATCTIERVEKNLTECRAHVSADLVLANPRVRLTPP
jgi:hypothetical protein